MLLHSTSPSSTPRHFEHFLSQVASTGFRPAAQLGGALRREGSGGLEAATFTAYQSQPV